MPGNFLMGRQLGSRCRWPNVRGCDQSGDVAAGRRVDHGQPCNEHELQP